MEEIDQNSPILDKIHFVWSYDYDFQGLFEMDRYLYFYYSSTHVLYDKQRESVFKTKNPTQNYQKNLSAEMTCDELWQYFIGSFVPLYCEGNSLYGRLPKNLYNILNDCRSKLDSKLALLLKGLEDYFSMYNLLSDDVIIVRIDFEE